MSNKSNHNFQRYFSTWVKEGMQGDYQRTGISDHLYSSAQNSLKGKVALVTSVESATGREVALAFATAGVKMSITYYTGHDKALETRKLVKKISGTAPELIQCNMSFPEHCENAVSMVMREFGRLDIIVNHSLQKLPNLELEGMFREKNPEGFGNSVFSQYYLTKAALPYLDRGASIIHSTSVDFSQEKKQFIEYASYKGAFVSFMQTLSGQLGPKGIRLNGVAQRLLPFLPGATAAPTWEMNLSKIDPIIHASELAPFYVYLASASSHRHTGDFLYPEFNQENHSLTTSNRNPVKKHNGIEMHKKVTA